MNGRFFLNYNRQTQATNFLSGAFVTIENSGEEKKIIMLNSFLISRYFLLIFLLVSFIFILVLRFLFSHSCRTGQRFVGDLSR